MCQCCHKIQLDYLSNTKTYYYLGYLARSKPMHPHLGIYQPRDRSIWTEGNRTRTLGRGNHLRGLKLAEIKAHRRPKLGKETVYFSCIFAAHFASPEGIFISLRRVSFREIVLISVTREPSPYPLSLSEGLRLLVVRLFPCYFH